jgi:non-specific serine/threonine protein kinase/serine/threonine-protein kinase
MTPTRWQLLQDAVNAALEVAEEEKTGCLRNALGDDEELFRQALQILAAHQENDSSMQGIVAANVLEVLAQSGPQTGDRIGHYRLTGVIGQGGMGTVFRAERMDDQFRQQVAIKVMRAGFGEAHELVIRFRAERQILANLTHPNIARLLDGGITEAGLPYLVMEHIEGVPIDRFAESRKLSLTERIRLFRQVCLAVQQAHQNLVVHRDIKPANVLVTEDGVPKLLDFGIAKLLSPDALDQTMAITEPAERLMTPAYASPEQVRGETITTASDVYSLGVLLYELLTFARPYKTTGVHVVEAQRRICEDDPVRPSAQNRELNHELDDIILMAIRKEPFRRYSSAEALATDLERFLDGFPVQASSGAWLYNAGKFVRRNRLAAAAAILLVVLAAGWVLSLQREQRRTRERFNEVREMAETFLFRFDESIRGMTGSIGARKLVVAEGLKYLNLLSADATHDPALSEELADAYHRIALIQYQAGIPHVGDLAGSIASLHREEALLNPLVASQPDNTRLRVKLARCFDMLAFNLAITSFGHAAARQYRQQNLKILEDLSTKAPADEDVQSELSNAEMGEAQNERRQGNPKAALARYRAALQLRERLLASKPQNLRRAISVVWSRIFVADVLGSNEDYTMKDRQGALKEYDQAEQLAERLRQENPLKSEPVRLLATVAQKRAGVFTALDDSKSALAQSRRSLQLLLDLASKDTGNEESERDVAIAYGNLADALARSGNLKASVDAYNQEQMQVKKLLARQPSSLQARLDVAIGDANISEKLIDWGHFQEAAAHAKAAVQGFQDMMQRDPQHAAYRFYLAISEKLLGEAQERQGQCGEALGWLEKAQAIVTDPAWTKKMPASAEGLAGEIAKDTAVCRHSPVAGR